MSESKRKVKWPGATAGEWMNTLLPLAVLLQFSQTSFASGQCSPLTVGALGFAPFVAGTFLSRTWPGKSSMQNTFVCCVMSALSIFVFAKTGFLYSIAVGVITTFGFQHLVNTLLKSFPLSFTIGEACVVSQGLLLFIMSSVSNMLYSLHKNPSDCVGIATLILQVGLMGVGLICTAVWLVPALRVVVPFYAVVFIVAAGMVVPLLYFFLQLNPVLWIVQMLFEDQYTIALVFYWIACCMLAVIALSFQVKAGKHASTSIRKYFHVLAVAVFLPGLILRPCLLYLSSGVILALFIIFEVFRILQMPPLGVVLQDAYSIFVDEKDAGVLALTPIYLLVGCSVPVWLHPVVSQEALLQLVSGLLAVGIGDTAASVCGHNFGRHKWKGSMKTKEGTAASIVSQMSVLVILAKLGFLRSSGNEYCKMLIAVIISSIVEAKTEQVDNLCLPLITYILLNAPT